MILEESSRYLFFTWWFVIIMPCTCRHRKLYTYEIWGPQQWWYDDWATGLWFKSYRSKWVFSFKHPDWLWGPSSSLFSEYQGIFPWVGGCKYQGWQLTSHLHIVLKLRMSGAVPPLYMISWHVQGLLHFLQWQYIKVMLWNVTQCSYYKCLGGMCCLRTQGRR